MAIAYKSAGAGVATETSGAACSPASPAVVDAGDILIIHAYFEGTTTAPSTPAGFTLLSGPHVIETTIGRHWIYGKIAAGTEDGAANALGTAAVTTMRSGRCYSFSGRVAGTITDLVVGFSHISHATDPQMPTVTTTIAGGLAVACVVQNDNNALAAATGMSGGTWAEAVAEFVAALTPGLVLQLQTCTPTADPGTVSGGSVAATNDPSGVIGFEIRPDIPVTPIDGTAATTAAAQISAATGDVVASGTAASSSSAQTSAATAAALITGTIATDASAQTTAAEGDVVGDISGTIATSASPQVTATTAAAAISGTCSSTSAAQTTSLAGAVITSGTSASSATVQATSAQATSAIAGTAATAAASESTASTATARIDGTAATQASAQATSAEGTVGGLSDITGTIATLASAQQTAAAGELGPVPLTGTIATTSTTQTSAAAASILSTGAIVTAAIAQITAIVATTADGLPPTRYDRVPRRRPHEIGGAMDRESFYGRARPRRKP